MNDTPNEHPTASTSDLPLDPPLSAEQARALGCLIEKEGTTPETYPLTQNAVVTAANQKTSRNPVMKLDPGRVGQALRSTGAKRPGRLRIRRARLSLPPSRRFRAQAHRRPARADRTAAAPWPQTLAELYTRSERMHRFDDLDDVKYSLDRLAARDAPMVVRLPRGPGQREDRYMHRLCGPVDTTPPEPHPAASATPAEENDLARRVAELEERVAELERNGSTDDGLRRRSRLT